MSSIADNKDDIEKNIEENSRLLADVNVSSEYGSGKVVTVVSENKMAEDPGRVWPQILAGLAATSAAIATGLNLGWTALLEDELRTTAYDFKLDDNQFAWIGSLFTLGGAAVCIPIGLLINVIGRKLTMLLLVLPFTLGNLLILFAVNPIMIYVARFILGVSGGAFCICGPVYTGEIASKEIRGALGCFFQLLLVFGILFAYLIGAYGTNQLFCYVSLAVPIIFFIVFIFMPESPMYLVSKDKMDKAASALKFLRGKEFNVDGEIANIQQELSLFKSEKKFSEVFARKATKKTLMVSLGLMFFQQLCGINAVIFYSGSIYKSANTNAVTGTVVVGIVQIVATLISVLIVDRIGRKLLLLISGLCMMICTIILGVYFKMQEHSEDSVKSINWLPIVLLCVFIAMFSFGYGPVPWLMIGEIFSPDIKNIAGPISGTFNWLLAFLVTNLFGTLVKILGAAITFWLFSACSLAGLFFVAIFCVETKNKTFSEIQEAYEK